MDETKRLVWDVEILGGLCKLALRLESEKISIEDIADLIMDDKYTVQAVEVVRCKECVHFGM